MTTATNKLHFRTRNAAAWQSWQEITTDSKDFIPAADSTYDIGTNTVRFANGYFDTLYGDGSNLTGITATETDTLATVTARGATTTTQMSVGSLVNSVGSYNSKLDLSGEGGFHSSKFTFNNQGRFIAGQVSVKGSNDIFFQAAPSSTSGYGFLETWQGAGMVVGTGGNANPVIFQINRSEKMRIAASTGNVLIGTTTDSGYKLAVNGTTQIIGDSSTDGSMRIRSSKGTSQSHVHYGTTADWYIRSADTSGKVVIQDSGGSVGIGTSSPNSSYKLDVDGDTNVNGDYFVNGNQGWSGTITIDQSPAPAIAITVEGGIITNVT